MKWRGHVAIEDDQEFCACTECNLPARYPCDTPAWCYAHWPQPARPPLTIDRELIEEEAVWESHLQWLVRRVDRVAARQFAQENRRQKNPTGREKRPAGRKMVEKERNVQEENFAEMMEVYDV